MSVKRQATTELNHENWDDEEPSDDKNMGQFRAASTDVLEKRVIRTAKRRNPISSEASKSVFSGFGGFNKTQKTSFDFLANLTNGAKNTNGSTNTNNTESTTSTGLFSNKPTTNSGGLFGAQSSSSPSKPSQTTTWSSPFGSSAKSPSSLFSATNKDIVSKDTPAPQTSPSQGSTKPTTSVFGVPSTSTNESKSSSTKNSSPFKIQTSSSTTTATAQTTFGATTPAVPTITPEKKSEDEPDENKIKYFSKLKALNEAVSDWINKHVAQTPLCILSPIFNDYEKYLKEISEEYHKNKDKTDNTNSERTTTPFGVNNTGSSPFTSSQHTKSAAPFGLNNATSSTTNQDKVSSPFSFANTNSSPMKTQDTAKPTTDSKSSGLFAFSNISKQDTKTSSVFGVNDTESKQATKATPFTLSAGSPTTKGEDTKIPTSFGSNSSTKQDNKISTSTPFATKSTGSSLFTNSVKNSDTTTNSPFAMNAGLSPLNSSTPKPSPFGTQNNSLTSPENKQPSFSFGIKTPSNDSTTSKPSAGFTFGTTPLSTTTASSPFSSTTSTTQSTTAPFSFGVGKPFSFSTNNVQKPAGESKATEENEDEEPPKVEYTPVQEENSVYDKKCKIFVKKDGNFVDKGVGTLYIKKIEGNVKHQLLVRANTNLGTVLLNLVLAEAIPTQRMGKNNVMIVCIPTPDSKPPPTPILIRVKTGEEADELLETLNKYKA